MHWLVDSGCWLRSCSVHYLDLKFAAGASSVSECAKPALSDDCPLNTFFLFWDFESPNSDKEVKLG